VLLVIGAISFVLVLSTAISLSAGHGIDQIALALPVLLVFWFLDTQLGDSLENEEFFFAPAIHLSSAFTRGPPA